MRLTRYLRGIIYGLMLAGYSVADIVDEVEKPDGLRPRFFAVQQSLQLSEEEGGMAQAPCETRHGVALRRRSGHGT